MSSKKTIVTIGDGIAAWCLSHALKDYSNIEVINIADNETRPPCSKSTTSLNCLRGTRGGLTLLGDLIRDSYFLFEEFNKTYSPDGVAKGIEHSLWPFEKDEKWRRRYKTFGTTKESDFVSTLIDGEQSYMPNPAYFIDPISLEKWFKKECQQVSYKNARVQTITHIDGGRYLLGLNDDSIVTADKVIICTNHAARELAYGYDAKIDYYLDHCKPVAGSYLQISLEEFDFNINSAESFNIAFESKHFIYRKEAGIVQIGSTSENRSDDLTPQSEKLRDIYDYVNENTKFELPRFEEFTQHAGVRHKGFERKPKWGKVDGNGLFMACGLYRNAFTFSFLAAKEIVSQLGLK